MRWYWFLLVVMLACPVAAGELPPVKLGLVIPMAGEVDEYIDGSSSAVTVHSRENAGGGVEPICRATFSQTVDRSLQCQS